MDLGLKDRVAIVTAASRGLGRAIAEGLAHEGAHVVICARTPELLTRTAEEIHARTGSAVIAIPADVTRETDVARLVAHTCDRFGRIDVLVCNAGGPPSGAFLNFSPDDWRQAFELNMLSTIMLCRAVVPQMKQQRWGRIINITSMAAKQPIDGLILSNSVRPGVHGFAKSLARDLAADNITVNCVCPGYTRTERLIELAEQIALREGVRPEDVYRRWENMIPMKRLAEPRELADLVVFLASERASYITGTSIQVDGGFIGGIF
jgi:3-oxoacyl-[acyl-carrier protein] reductase